MIEWNYCQKELGIFFRQESLLEQAFVHLSYVNENPGFALPSNERLEFLGDAILNFIVTEKLYNFEEKFLLRLLPLQMGHQLAHIYKSSNLPKPLLPLV